MAITTTTAEAVQTRELAPVVSRVSWSAIFAGVFVALAIDFLLTVLGAAIGLSIAKSGATRGLGTGAAIYAIVATLISLFVGGWVTSQCSLGAEKRDAVVHGVVLWGVLSALLTWLAVSGVQTGFESLMSTRTPATVSSSPTVPGDASVVQATPPDRTSDAARRLDQTVRDPDTAKGAWLAFAGVVITMLASVFGAIAGAGRKVFFRSLVVRQTSTTNPEMTPRRY
jgi:hypothetical protein